MMRTLVVQFTVTSEDVQSIVKDRGPMMDSNGQIIDYEHGHDKIRCRVIAPPPLDQQRGTEAYFEMENLLGEMNWQVIVNQGVVVGGRAIYRRDVMDLAMHRMAGMIGVIQSDPTRPLFVDLDIAGLNAVDASATASGA